MRIQSSFNAHFSTGSFSQSSILLPKNMMNSVSKQSDNIMVALFPK